MPNLLIDHVPYLACLSNNKIGWCIKGAGECMKAFTALLFLVPDALRNIRNT